MKKEELEKVLQEALVPPPPEVTLVGIVKELSEDTIEFCQPGAPEDCTKLPLELIEEATLLTRTAEETPMPIMRLTLREPDDPDPNTKALFALLRRSARRVGLPAPGATFAGPGVDVGTWGARRVSLYAGKPGVSKDPTDTGVCEPDIDTQTFCGRCILVWEDGVESWKQPCTYVTYQLDYDYIPGHVGIGGVEVPPTCLPGIWRVIDSQEIWHSCRPTMREWLSAQLPTLEPSVGKYLVR